MSVKSQVCSRNSEYNSSVWGQVGLMPDCFGSRGVARQKLMHGAHDGGRELRGTEPREKLPPHCPRRYLRHHQTRLCDGGSLLGWIHRVGHPPPREPHAWMWPAGMKDVALKFARAALCAQVSDKLAPQFVPRDVRAALGLRAQSHSESESSASRAYANANGSGRLDSLAALLADPSHGALEGGGLSVRSFEKSSLPPLTTPTCTAVRAYVGDSSPRGPPAGPPRAPRGAPPAGAVGVTTG